LIRVTNILPYFSFDIPDDRSSTYVEALEQVISGRDPQLIMCVVTNNRSDRYASIKKKCCVDRAGELDFKFVRGSYHGLIFLWGFQFLISISSLVSCSVM
jgi:hypothetical protein